MQKYLFIHYCLPLPSPLQMLRFVWINYVFFSKSRVRSQKYFFKETRICFDKFHTFTRVREYRTPVVKF